LIAILFRWGVSSEQEHLQAVAGEDVRGHAAGSAGSDDNRVIGLGQVYFGFHHEQTLLALNRLDSVATLFAALQNVDYAKRRADQGCKNRKARGHSTMDRRLCPVQRLRGETPLAFFHASAMTE
jgi:hypothetical protein